MYASNIIRYKVADSDTWLPMLTSADATYVQSVPSCVLDPRRESYFQLMLHYTCKHISNKKNRRAWGLDWISNEDDWNEDFKNKQVSMRINPAHYTTYGDINPPDFATYGLCGNILTPLQNDISGLKIGHTYDCYDGGVWRVGTVLDVQGTSLRAWLEAKGVNKSFENGMPVAVQLQGEVAFKHATLLQQLENKNQWKVKYGEKDGNSTKVVDTNCIMHRLEAELRSLGVESIHHLEDLRKEDIKNTNLEILQEDLDKFWKAVNDTSEILSDQECYEVKIRFDDDFEKKESNLYRFYNEVDWHDKLTPIRELYTSGNTQQQHTDSKKEKYVIDKYLKNQSIETLDDHQLNLCYDKDIWRTKLTPTEFNEYSKTFNIRTGSGVDDDVDLKNTVFRLMYPYKALKQAVLAYYFHMRMKEDVLDWDGALNTTVETKQSWNSQTFSHQMKSHTKSLEDIVDRLLSNPGFTNDILSLYIVMHKKYGHRPDFSDERLQNFLNIDRGTVERVIFPNQQLIFAAPWNYPDGAEKLRINRGRWFYEMKINKNDPSKEIRFGWVKSTSKTYPYYQEGTDPGKYSLGGTARKYKVVGSSVDSYSLGFCISHNSLYICKDGDKEEIDDFKDKITYPTAFVFGTGIDLDNNRVYFGINGVYYRLDELNSKYSFEALEADQHIFPIISGQNAEVLVNFGKNSHTLKHLLGVEKFRPWNHSLVRNDDCSISALLHLTSEYPQEEKLYQECLAKEGKARQEAADREREKKEREERWKREEVELEQERDRQREIEAEYQRYWERKQLKRRYKHFKIPFGNAEALKAAEDAEREEQDRENKARIAQQEYDAEYGQGGIHYDTSQDDRVWYEPDSEERNIATDRAHWNFQEGKGLCIAEYHEDLEDSDDILKRYDSPDEDDPPESITAF